VLPHEASYALDESLGAVEGEALVVFGLDAEGAPSNQIPRDVNLLGARHARPVPQAARGDAVEGSTECGAKLIVVFLAKNKLHISADLSRNRVAA